MKVAIAGHGVEGEENLRYWMKDSANDVTVVDQHSPSRLVPEGVPTIIGEDAFSKLEGYDLVVRTAGLAPYKIKTDGKVWSATNEFFAKCPCLIIGVTGTKGKGTTASLIASILEAAGKKAWLIGNIGKPALSTLNDIKPDDIVVYELSSFQLWDIEKSPRRAVLLHIEGDHLDVHADMDDYLKAKANITRFQTADDVLIFNKSNKHSSDIALKSVAKKVGYPDLTTAHIKDDYFYYGDKKLCAVSSLQLIGQHNQDNACAAIDATWAVTQDEKVIDAGLKAFKGLPHRLKFVRQVETVDYYDDSISTTPGSAIAALKAFDTSKVIILGGSSKGMDFSDLAGELAEQNDTLAIIIGDEAQKIAESCIVAGFNRYEIIENPTMEKVVARAHKLAQPGGTVLLSPACASFGLFDNYQDRGDQFIEAVRAL